MTTTTTTPATTTTIAPVDSGPLLLQTTFADGTPVPRELTCDGAGAAPTLWWSGVPAGTPELALVVTDADAGDFLHWVVTGIDPALGAVSLTAPPGAIEARNDAGTLGWTPPCPPAGEQHDYLFSLYALAEPLGLAPDVAGDDAVALILDGAIASTSVLGTYRREP